MKKNLAVEKALLELKVENLEKDLHECHHKIRELEMTVSDLGGCACPKCLAGWGGRKGRDS